MAASRGHFYRNPGPTTSDRILRAMDRGRSILPALVGRSLRNVFDWKRVFDRRDDPRLRGI
jgi:hypothetical protein